MSLPSVASEPNVVVASRRPGAPANRADGAPAQPADSFASALDNNGGGDTPVATGEPATTPGATGQPDQTTSAVKGQPASPIGITITAATTAVGDGVSAALDAIALAAGVQISTDGKVAQAGKAGAAKSRDDAANPDNAIPDGGAAAGTTTTQADPTIQAPILAVLVPVPLVSPTPTSMVAPEGQAGAAPGIAPADVTGTGAAAAGIAAASAAPTGTTAIGAATAGTIAAGAAVALPDNAMPAVDATVAGKVQGMLEPAPDPALVAAALVSLPAGIDPKALQFLATARVSGDGKPIARAATNPTRGQETPHAPAAATSDAADSSTGSLAAAAQVQSHSSDPHGDDVSSRKGPHGEAAAGPPETASAEPTAQRSGAAATAILANASAGLTAHATDATQSTGATTPVVAPAAASAGSPPPIVVAPAAAAQVAASYVAAVPLSELAAEITAQARNGKNRFEIRLDPPDLGRIDVRLDVDRQGQVTSHLVVDRSETLDLLRRDAPSLERALQSAGLKTDGGLEFSLRDQAFGRDRSTQDAPPTPVTSPLPDDELAPVAAAQRSYWRLSGLGSGVDISV